MKTLEWSPQNPRLCWPMPKGTERPTRKKPVGPGVGNTLYPCLTLPHLLPSNCINKEGGCLSEGQEALPYLARWGRRDGKRSPISLHVPQWKATASRLLPFPDLSGTGSQQTGTHPGAHSSPPFSPSPARIRRPESVSQRREEHEKWLAVPFFYSRVAVAHLIHRFWPADLDQRRQWLRPDPGQQCFGQEPATLILLYGHTDRACTSHCSKLQRWSPSPQSQVDRLLDLRLMALCWSLHLPPCMFMQ